MAKGKSIKSAPEKKEESAAFESICGIILALFAAVLAVSGLGGGNTSKGQMVAQTEKGSAYEWYNSKSIKLNLVKGQKDMLESLIKSGAIGKDQRKNLEDSIESLKKNIEKYEANGAEILEGSKLTALKKIETDAFEGEILPKIKNPDEKKFVSSYFSKDKDGRFYILKQGTSYDAVYRLFDIAVEKTGYKSPRWLQDYNGKFGVIYGANEWNDKTLKIADADGRFDMANLFLQLCLVLGAISIVLHKKIIKFAMFGAMIAVGIAGTIYTVLGFIASSGLV